MGANKRDKAIVRNRQDKKIKYIINQRPSQIKKLSHSGQWYTKEIYEQQTKLQNQIDPLARTIKNKIADVSQKIRNVNIAISNGIWNSSTSQMLSELEKQELDLQLLSHTRFAGAPGVV